VDGNIRPGVAAKRPGLTWRQAHRLVERYNAEGARGLVSRHRGKPSNRQLATGVEPYALELIREHCFDFDPTLVHEKLREQHDLHFCAYFCAVETLFNNK
jgi:molybdenum-dependent DNA-binding transcriptional regulator ModE